MCFAEFMVYSTGRGSRNLINTDAQKAMSTKNRMIWAAERAADEAKDLCDKALETGDYDYIAKARDVIERAEHEVQEIENDATRDVMSSLGEGEDIVHTRSDFHDEILQGGSITYEIFKAAKHSIDFTSRDRRIRYSGPSGTMRIWQP